MNYRGPNLHDFDAYDVIAMQALKNSGREYVETHPRKLPDSIKLKNSKTIEFTLPDRDPYCVGEKLYKGRIVRLKYGLNVLVGPNGSGKSTILRMLREQLACNYYEYYNFDNLRDGGNHSISKAGFESNFGFMSAMLSSSEGEGIMNNLHDVFRGFGSFVTDQQKKYPGEPIFILLDGIDSGLSVNNIAELKILFNMIKDNDTNVIIIATANTYEMVRDAYCWDVKNSKSVKFKSYEEYFDFIINNSHNLGD